MIEFKIIQGKKETYLLVISLLSWNWRDLFRWNIWKKYSLKYLYKENRHFRIYDDVKEAKNIINEF